MIKRATPVTFWLLLLSFVCTSVTSQVHAQAIDSNPSAALAGTRMVESSISKVYRARVLLEDYRNWAESYELIRDVLKNDDSLNKTAKKKLEKAAGQIKAYLPSKWFRQTFNGRHLIRPFLEASYLINEALMDSRVALNTSSDTEVVFVEQLLKSYFFPGNEATGVIEFPEASTYSFDLYSLNAKNIAAARRERSDQKDEALENAAANANNSVGVGVIDAAAPGIDLDDKQLNARFAAANGFILGLIDGGLAIAEITKEVQSVIKKYEVPDRVNNRYLELSMLMQAVVDPGTALFDPQLQSFLRGVRLKVALGQADKGGLEDLMSLRSLFGNNAIVQKDGETRIRLGYLMDQQRGNPYLKNGLELALKDIKGSDRAILYAISTVSGEEQIALRTLQMAATLARDAERAAAVAAGIRNAVPALGKLQSLGSISLTKLVSMLPQAAAMVNEMAILANSGAVGAGLRTAAWALKGLVSVQNVGVKIASTMSPRAIKLIAAFKNNKHVKNGTVTGVLTLAVAATQITVGVIEYRASDDPDRKFDIYIDTTARVAATATYMVPYVGWAAAALDLGHAFLGVPFETADVYKGYSWAVGATTLWFLGTSNTEIEMLQIEAALNIPRANVFFTRYGVRDDMVGSLEKAQTALNKLQAEYQQVALNELSFLYVAHRSFASDTNYKFGQRLEEHYRSLLQNKKAVQETEKILKQKILEFQLLEFSALGGAEGSGRDGTEAAKA